MFTIAIDYDGTYARFPEQFTALRQSFQCSGGKVYLVTARCEQMMPIPEKDKIGFDDVIYTCNKAKASVVEADIFIDDNPITLCTEMKFDDGTIVEGYPSSNLYQSYDGQDFLWHWNHERGCFESEKQVTKTGAIKCGTTEE